MKKTVIILGFILVFFSLSAQTWFPVNAEWTYRTVSPCDPFNGHGIDYIKCIKDTLIEGNRASVISGFSGCSPFYNIYDKQIFYYNPAEDIVYVLINEDKIDVSTLKSGYYILKTSTSKGINASKFVKF